MNAGSSPSSEEFEVLSQSTTKSYKKPSSLLTSEPFRYLAERFNPCHGNLCDNPLPLPTTDFQNLSDKLSSLSGMRKETKGTTVKKGATFHTCNRTAMLGFFYLDCERYQFFNSYLRYCRRSLCSIGGTTLSDLKTYKKYVIDGTHLARSTVAETINVRFLQGVQYQPLRQRKRETIKKVSSKLNIEEGIVYTFKATMLFHSRPY
ncbi:hypothetical protein AVEN_200684-1 [Araneus ventricosus]|uniref:Uncharacterized protein n=1 Tax=Araneus ventricosus TaxID=182803 RepID=A0A4Y2JC84_ARAVE|nr:hypothetical protein AVEN_200684-1 [Araneus ventricosus]